MRFRLGAVVAASMVIVSCSGTTTADSFDLVEFAVNGPAAMSADPQTVTVTNSGAFQHTLVVTDSAGSVVAATPLIESGEAVDMSLDLDPGQYSFTCRIVAQKPDGDLVDHFEEGMATTVTVQG